MSIDQPRLLNLVILGEELLSCPWAQENLLKLALPSGLMWLSRTVEALPTSLVALGSVKVSVIMANPPQESGESIESCIVSKNESCIIMVVRANMTSVKNCF